MTYWIPRFEKHFCYFCCSCYGAAGSIAFHGFDAALILQTESAGRGEIIAPGRELVVRQQPSGGYPLGRGDSVAIVPRLDLVRRSSTRRWCGIRQRRSMRLSSVLLLQSYDKGQTEEKPLTQRTATTTW